MEVLDWDFTKEVKSRSVVSVASCAFQQHFGVHNNTVANLGRALQERVFKVVRDGQLVDPPRPTPGSLDRYKFKELWEKSLRYCRRATHHEVVASYKGRKASRYSNACDSLFETPVTSDDAKLTAFLKAEKTNLTIKTDPAPRLIQFPNPRYSLELMTYLKYNEKTFMKAIDEVWGEQTVMSGYNCEELGNIMRKKWDQFKRPVAVPLDFSRFDQHCSTQALDYEFDFYHRAFDYDPHLMWLTSLQRQPRGTAVAADGAIAYRCPLGGRGSGQINTSMGNKLIVCGLMWEFFDEIELKASLANMGDDCVIFLEEEDLSKLQSRLHGWWETRGYNAITEDPCYKLEHIEFCQSHPVEINGEYIMVRTPEKAMSKDCITLSASETVSQIAASYMAISTCGRIINSGVPMMFALHDCLFRAASKYTKMVEISDDWMFKQVEYGNYERMKNLNYTRKHISDRSRLSFYEAFGITPDTQILVEEYYNSLDLDFGDGVENVNSIEFYSALPAILLTN